MDIREMGIKMDLGLCLTLVKIAIIKKTLRIGGNNYIVFHYTMQVEM